MIGCDICQRVCPYNALPERERQDTDEFTLAELLACAPDTMERFATLYGRNYAIRNRVIAQALLAAANSGDTAFLPADYGAGKQPFARCGGACPLGCNKIERFTESLLKKYYKT